jgi:hypothetical protein
MKKIYVFGTALLLAAVTGCYTSRQVSTMQGHGTKQTFNASYDQVWRAAVDAAQQPGLSVISADRTSGYISTHRTIRPHTFGENVGIWVTSTSPSQTAVEVVSRQAGPPVAWLKNWENEVLRSVAANLTREVPTAVGSAPPESYSTTGQYPAPSAYERSTTSTLNQSPTSDRIAQEQRRLEQVRQEQEQRREELAREQDQERRQKLNDEIERLRGELRTIETRLSDLEAEQKQIK